MSSTALLPHEIQMCRCDRWRKLAEKTDDRLEVATAFDQQAKGSRLTANSLRRQTLFQASRIRWRQDHPDIPQTRDLGCTRDGTSQGKSLIPNDAKALHFHPGPSPGDGLRGGSGLVPSPPVPKRYEGRLRPPQFGAMRDACSRGANTSPRQQRRAEHRGNQPRHGRSDQVGPKSKRRSIFSHQPFLGDGRPNDI